MKVPAFKSGEYIAKRIPFQSNGNFKADQRGDIYIVWSYSTIIATWTEEGGWSLNNAKHSSTTSRHQSIVRKAVGA